MSQNIEEDCKNVISVFEACARKISLESIIVTEHDKLTMKQRTNFITENSGIYGLCKQYIRSPDYDFNSYMNRKDKTVFRSCPVSMVEPKNPNIDDSCEKIIDTFEKCRDQFLGVNTHSFKTESDKLSFEAKMKQNGDFIGDTKNNKMYALCKKHMESTDRVISHKIMYNIDYLDVYSKNTKQGWGGF
jgi:hypothetical protein